MKTGSTNSRRARSPQSGVMLIEVMIAIVIFAFGILGIVSLQGVAVSQVSDAKYRSDASFLANDLIGTMWLGDRTTAVLQAQYNTGNPGYTTWKNKVVGTLPGATFNAPTVVVDNAGIVTVTIFWLPPNAPAGTAYHQYVAVAQIQ